MLQGLFHEFGGVYVFGAESIRCEDGGDMFDMNLCESGDDVHV